MNQEYRKKIYYVAYEVTEMADRLKDFYQSF